MRINNMNKQEALKKIEELKQYVEKLSKVEYYDCVTPIDASGDILFNKHRQLLYINCVTKLYVVCSTCGMVSDSREDFVWVPCRREDLKPRDTAYRTDDLDYDFSCKRQMCKILDDSNYAFVEYNTDIIIYDCSFEYWYKLVPRNKV
jgi:hypothetical protein